MPKYWFVRYSGDLRQLTEHGPRQTIWNDTTTLHPLLYIQRMYETEKDDKYYRHFKLLFFHEISLEVYQATYNMYDHLFED